MPRGVVRFAAHPPAPGDAWDAPSRVRAQTLAVASFRPEGSDHRPLTNARLQHDGAALHGIFRVEDRFVRCVHPGFQAEVWRDSCVEVFLKPPGAAGYFAFEFGCGGALRALYVTDHRRTAGGFRASVPLGEDEGRQVAVAATLPPVVDPEIADPTTWTLGFSIPFALLARRAGVAVRAGGEPWRGNLQKCGDDTSHPHWASWAPLPERNFHLPECFGVLAFETAEE